MKPQAELNSYLVLSPTEAKALRFVGARKLGATVSDISRDVKLARTSIYNAVRSLEAKQLLKREGFRYHVLNSLTTYQEQCTQGVPKRIDDVLSEILKLKKGEVVYSIESDDEISALLECDAGLPDWQKAVADKGIVLKGIGSTEALSLFQARIGDAARHEIEKRSGAARFTDDMLEGSGVLLTFEKTLVVFSRHRDYFYRIDDSDVAQFIQSIVELLYSLLEYHPIVKSSTL